MEIVSSRKDYSEWSMRHTSIKNKENVAALITMDGAFMDFKLRKITNPPIEAVKVFSQIPVSDDFKWVSE